MKKKVLSMILIASMALGLVACGNASSDNTSSDAPAAAESGDAADAGNTAADTSADSGEVVTTENNADTGVLRINLASEPDYLDPQLNSSVDGGCLAVNSFAGLYTYDENLNLVPDLADGEAQMVVNDDGTVTYTFKLVKSKWSNGDVLNANDFVYSWNRAVAPETAADYSYLFDVVSRNDDDSLMVEAPDDNTLVVTLVSPIPYFLDLCAFPTFFPVHQASCEAASPDGTNPSAWCQEAGFVCNGPYMCTEWKHNESMVYEANPNYHKASEVTMPRLEFMLSADDTAILAAYNAGDVDYIDSVPTDEIAKLKSSPEFGILDNLGTYYVGFNVNSDTFKGKTVEEAAKMREAMSLLIDRRYIVDEVGQCEQVLADSFIPKGMADGNGGEFKGSISYYDAEATGSTDPDNVAKAVALLEEAGYTLTDKGDGTYSIDPALNITYLTNESSGHQAIAEIIQQDFAAVGIGVTIEVEDWNVFLEDRKNGNFDVAREGWLADYNDPINMLEMWLTDGGNNDMQFGRNPENKATPAWTEYDALIKEIYNTSDFAKRVELMHQAEDMLMSTWAVVPIYYYNDLYMQKSNVSGIYATVFGMKYFQNAKKN